MISVAVIFGAKTKLPELDLLLEVGVGLSHVLVFAGCLASPVRRVAPPMQLSALWNYAYNSMVTMCRTYLRLKPQSKVRKKKGAWDSTPVVMATSQQQAFTSKK